MSGKPATPKQIAEMIALREVGYTELAVSQKIGVSLRTVQRHLQAHGTKKGTLKTEVIAQARDDLLKLVTSDETIRTEAAKLISDDLAHSNHIRSIMLEASEHLTATTVKEAALVMRAMAAYSTAIKNTSDTIRHVLRTDQMEDDAADLPELIVRELTLEEVAEMRREQEECETV